MIIRKNISLTEEYLKKLDPLLKKHDNNLSAVIREVIDFENAALQDPDSVKQLISRSKNEQNLTSATLSWALKNLSGRLPDKETVHNIIGGNIFSISELEKRLNELSGEIYWGSSVRISSDDDKQPGTSTFTITGKSQNTSRFLAAVIAAFASEKYNLGISQIRDINNVLEMNMRKGEKEWAFESVTRNFGYMNDIFSELNQRQDFWNIIINLYVKMNYDMVAIQKKCFEEIMSGKAVPKISTFIENVCGCPVNQIPLEDLLKKIKLIFQASGLITNIEINKESLIIHHGFVEPQAIEKLANMFVELLFLNGCKYSSTACESLIILKREADMNRILVKVVDGLKDDAAVSKANLTKILDMLQNVPSNEAFIKSLGSKFGRHMIQNYEKSINVGRWDMDIFIRYLKEMNSILSQDSEWELVGKNIAYGKILACPLVKCNGGVNTTTCTFIKGMFDGCVSHAFGEQPERIYRSNAEATGKNVCEIYIAI